MQTWESWRTPTVNSRVASFDRHEYIRFVTRVLSRGDAKM